MDDSCPVRHGSPRLSLPAENKERLPLEHRKDIILPLDPHPLLAIPLPPLPSDLSKDLPLELLVALVEGADFEDLGGGVGVGDEGGLDAAEVSWETGERGVLGAFDVVVGPFYENKIGSEIVTEENIRRLTILGLTPTRTSLLGRA